MALEPPSPSAENGQGDPMRRSPPLQTGSHLGMGSDAERQIRNLIETFHCKSSAVPVPVVLPQNGGTPLSDHVEIEQGDGPKPKGKTRTRTLVSGAPFVPLPDATEVPNNQLNATLARHMGLVAELRELEHDATHTSMPLLSAFREALLLADYLQTQSMLAVESNPEHLTVCTACQKRLGPTVYLLMKSLLEHATNTTGSSDSAALFSSDVSMTYLFLLGFFIRTALRSLTLAAFRFITSNNSDIYNSASSSSLTPDTAQTMSPGFEGGEREKRAPSSLRCSSVPLSSAPSFRSNLMQRLMRCVAGEDVSNLTAVFLYSPTLEVASLELEKLVQRLRPSIAKLSLYNGAFPGASVMGQNTSALFKKDTALLEQQWIACEQFATFFGDTDERYQVEKTNACCFGSRGSREKALHHFQAATAALTATKTLQRLFRVLEILQEASFVSSPSRDSLTLSAECLKAQLRDQAPIIAVFCLNTKEEEQKEKERLSLSEDTWSTTEFLLILQQRIAQILGEAAENITLGKTQTSSWQKECQRHTNPHCSLIRFQLHKIWDIVQPPHDAPETKLWWNFVRRLAKTVCDEQMVMTIPSSLSVSMLPDDGTAPELASKLDKKDDKKKKKGEEEFFSQHCYGENGNSDRMPMSGREKDSIEQRRQLCSSEPAAKGHSRASRTENGLQISKSIEKPIGSCAFQGEEPDGRRSERDYMSHYPGEAAEETALLHWTPEKGYHGTTERGTFPPPQKRDIFVAPPRFITDILQRCNCENAFYAWFPHAITLMLTGLSEFRCIDLGSTGFPPPTCLIRHTEREVRVWRSTSSSISFVEKRCTLYIPEALFSDRLLQCIRSTELSAPDTFNWTCRIEQHPEAHQLDLSRDILDSNTQGGGYDSASQVLTSSKTGTPCDIRQNAPNLSPFVGNAEEDMFHSLPCVMWDTRLAQEDIKSAFEMLRPLVQLQIWSPVPFPAMGLRMLTESQINHSDQGEGEENNDEEEEDVNDNVASAVGPPFTLETFLNQTAAKNSPIYERPRKKRRHEKGGMLTGPGGDILKFSDSETDSNVSCHEYSAESHLHPPHSFSSSSPAQSLPPAQGMAVFLNLNKEDGTSSGLAQRNYGTKVTMYQKASSFTHREQKEQGESLHSQTSVKGDAENHRTNRTVSRIVTNEAPTLICRYSESFQKASAEFQQKRREASCAYPHTPITPQCMTDNPQQRIFLAPAVECPRCWAWDIKVSSSFSPLAATVRGRYRSEISFHSLVRFPGPFQAGEGCRRVARWYRHGYLKRLHLLKRTAVFARRLFKAWKRAIDKADGWRLFLGDIFAWGVLPVRAYHHPDQWVPLPAGYHASAQHPGSLWGDSSSGGNSPSPFLDRPPTWPRTAELLRPSECYLLAPVTSSTEIESISANHTTHPLRQNSCSPGSHDRFIEQNGELLYQRTKELDGDVAVPTTIATVTNTIALSDTPHKEEDCSIPRPLRPAGFLKEPLKCSHPRPSIFLSGTHSRNACGESENYDRCLVETCRSSPAVRFQRFWGIGLGAQSIAELEGIQTIRNYIAASSCSDPNVVFAAAVYRNPFPMLLMTSSLTERAGSIMASGILPGGASTGVLNGISADVGTPVTTRTRASAGPRGFGVIGVPCSTALSTSNASGTSTAGPQQRDFKDTIEKSSGATSTTSSINSRSSTLTRHSLTATVTPSASNRDWMQSAYENLPGPPPRWRHSALFRLGGDRDFGCLRGCSTEWHTSDHPWRFDPIVTERVQKSSVCWSEIEIELFLSRFFVTPKDFKRISQAMASVLAVKQITTAAVGPCAFSIHTRDCRIKTELHCADFYYRFKYFFKLKQSVYDLRMAKLSVKQRVSGVAAQRTGSNIRRIPAKEQLVEKLMHRLRATFAELRTFNVRLERLKRTRPTVLATAQTSDVRNHPAEVIDLNRTGVFCDHPSPGIEQKRQSCCSLVSSNVEQVLEDYGTTTECNCSPPIETLARFFVEALRLRCPLPDATEVQARVCQQMRATPQLIKALRLPSVVVEDQLQPNLVNQGSSLHNRAPMTLETLHAISAFSMLRKACLTPVDQAGRLLLSDDRKVLSPANSTDTPRGLQYSRRSVTTLDTPQEGYIVPSHILGLFPMQKTAALPVSLVPGKTLLTQNLILFDNGTTALVPPSGTPAIAPSPKEDLFHIETLYPRSAALSAFFAHPNRAALLRRLHSLILLSRGAAAVTTSQKHVFGTSKPLPPSTHTIARPHRLDGLGLLRLLFKRPKQPKTHESAVDDMVSRVISSDLRSVENVRETQVTDAVQEENVTEELTELTTEAIRIFLRARQNNYEEYPEVYEEPVWCKRFGPSPPARPRAPPPSSQSFTRRQSIDSLLNSKPNTTASVTHDDTPLFRTRDSSPVPPPYLECLVADGNTSAAGGLASSASSSSSCLVPDVRNKRKRLSTIPTPKAMTHAPHYQHLTSSFTASVALLDTNPERLSTPRERRRSTHSGNTATSGGVEQELQRQGLSGSFKRSRIDALKEKRPPAGEHFTSHGGGRGGKGATGGVLASHNIRRGSSATLLDANKTPLLRGSLYRSSGVEDLPDASSERGSPPFAGCPVANSSSFLSSFSGREDDPSVLLPEFPTPSMPSTHASLPAQAPKTATEPRLLFLAEHTKQQTSSPVAQPLTSQDPYVTLPQQITSLFLPPVVEVPPVSNPLSALDPLPPALEDTIPSPYGSSSDPAVPDPLPPPAPSSERASNAPPKHVPVDKANTSSHPTRRRHHDHHHRHHHYHRKKRHSSSCSTEGTMKKQPAAEAGPPCSFSRSPCTGPSSNDVRTSTPTPPTTATTTTATMRSPSAPNTAGGPAVGIPPGFRHFPTAPLLDSPYYFSPAPHPDTLAHIAAYNRSFWGFRLPENPPGGVASTGVGPAAVAAAAAAAVAAGTPPAPASFSFYDPCAAAAAAAAGTGTAVSTASPSPRHPSSPPSPYTPLPPFFAPEAHPVVLDPRCYRPSDFFNLSAVAAAATASQLEGVLRLRSSPTLFAATHHHPAPPTASAIPGASSSLCFNGSSSSSSSNTAPAVPSTSSLRRGVHGVMGSPQLATAATSSPEGIVFHGPRGNASPYASLAGTAKRPETRNNELKKN